MHHPTFRTRHVLFSIIGIFLLIFVATVTAKRGVWRSKAVRTSLITQPNAPAAAAPLAPNITATKSATLATDLNGNGFANPGDTLMYSVTVSNMAAPGAGNDAMAVVFTDTLNSNLTLANTPTASPIATNDAYNVLGNVRIQVPAGSGLLVNDVNPQGTGTISVTGAPTTTTQGGNLAVNADGSFSYNPPPGYEGADSFTYTLTHSNGKSDTATVTFTVSGMIWFIDNNAAACTTLAGGCGRLTNPFSTLASFQALNNGTGNNPAAGDSIFLYRNTATTYTGPLTLLNNQKLGGTGMTVTLASFTGLTPPSFSDGLPSTNGTRPVIATAATSLTLGNGNSLRGFNVTNTAGAGITGTGFGNLTASEMNVTASNAGGACSAAISLTTGNPMASFTSVSANNCANGIVLQNTTGSFTVTGDGTNTTLGGNGSGGTISNTSGADLATTGNGVFLNSAQSVTLNRMLLSGHPNFAIRGLNVTNLTFAYSTISGTNGTTNSPANNVPEGALAFGLPGTVSQTAVNGISGNFNITNCDISGGLGGNLGVWNQSVTTALTISGSTFHDSTSGPGVNLNTGAPGNGTLPGGSAVISAMVTSTSFNNHFTAGFIFTGNATTGATPNLVSLGSGVTFNTNNVALDIGIGFAADMNLKVDGVTALNSTTNAFNIVSGADSTSAAVYQAEIKNNVIGNGTVDSGSRNTFGIGIDLRGDVDAIMSVTGNNVRNTDIEGIFVQSRLNNTAGQGKLDLTLTGNTVATPDDNSAFPFGAIHTTRVEARNSTTLTANISGNTFANGVGGLEGIRVRERDTAVFRLERLSDGDATPNEIITNTALVETRLLTDNPATTTVDAALLGTFVGFTEAANGVTRLPSIPMSFAPIEPPALAPENTPNSAQSTGGNSAEQHLQNCLRPAYTAFQSARGYVNLDRLFARAAGGTSTVSLALTNNYAMGVIASLTDTLTNMTAVDGPIGGTCATLAAINIPANATNLSFTGDGKSDLAQWLREAGAWQVTFSSDGVLRRIPLVEPNDKDDYVAVAADFDGDLKADAAVWRASDGRWLIRRSTDGELLKAQYGIVGDVPLAADCDGDGRADFAVWRTHENGLHVLRSSDQTEQAIYLGQAGDAPVLGDFDGDGLTDLAVYRASTGQWLLRDTATGALGDAQFGQAGDAALAADFDGDGKDDLLLWRSTEGAAYVRQSSDGAIQRASWGLLQEGEWLVIGDYDGDGRAEPAVWRAAKAAWDVRFKQTDR